MTDSQRISKDEILYVDDEMENLTVFKFAFRSYYKIHLAQSADEGMDILRQHNIRVIVTDQRMPQMTGIEFLEKTTLDYPDVVRIILTGYTDIESVVDAINLGQVYRYIKKPWDKDEFKITIDKALELYHLRQHNRQLVSDLQQANDTLTINLKELEVAKRKAEESDKLKTAFLASISHEIRTPLNIIVGFANLLNNPEVDNEQRSGFVEHITTNSDNLLRLIDDVLAIAKLDSSQTVVKKSNISLQILFEEVCNYMHTRLHQHNKSQQLEILIDKNFDNGTIIESDYQMLKQILHNILDNAIKFTHTGSIHFTCIYDNSCLYCSISDTGIGISVEKQAVIFNRFRKVTDDEARLYGGTGLGLAICKGYVEHLGGTITVVSEKDKGSTFIVEIPC